jgi:hypothetical protein
MLGPAARHPSAQVTPAESTTNEEFRHESEHIAEKCQAKWSALYGCPIEFVTDHPVHVAIGSLAPHNGFAVGLAFVTHRANEQRDMSWNADFVRAPQGSWRGGVYFKMVLTPVSAPTAVPIGPASVAESDVSLIHPYPVFDVYAQSTALRTVYFFGLGPDTSADARATFGMTETVIGTHAIFPFFSSTNLRRLNVAAIGEINSRLVDLKDAIDNAPDGISTRYGEPSVPGLSDQPAFLQFGEGVRFKPSVFNEKLHFNYLLKYQQFVAPSASRYSFQRWSVKLEHEVSLYGTVLSETSRDTHGPDDCSSGLGDSPCPSPSRSRNHYGSFGLGLYTSHASARDDGAVPFYFQETLGGSDIDGTRSISAYQDYRFRGSKVFAMRESFEHYVYSIIGLSVIAEQGTVALAETPLHVSRLKRSVAAGVSLRVGGLPVAYLMWAHGSEGGRFMAVMSTSLLGGSSRPSLQ